MGEAPVKIKAKEYSMRFRYSGPLNSDMARKASRTRSERNGVGVQSNGRIMLLAGVTVAGVVRFAVHGVEI